MTYIIIAFTSIVSFIALQNRVIFEKYLFNAYATIHHKQIYRIISHAFLHADFNHLLFNMLTLFFFGVYVESVFKMYFGNLGISYYMLLYFLAIIFSTLPAIIKHRNNQFYNAVGASGAVSAVLFSYILFDPFGKIIIFFIPIGIPAFIFGPAYLLYSAYMGKKGIDNIGHDAHFWGAIFGFIFPLLLDYKLFFHFLNQLIN
ncbi:MAG: hypothetical protein A2033_15755 [Bacteroidetes bacterium GWA2_31_9]|nr:MAG: hypothetical protein A2033_15755 [Bacteroidetes bacterium GWA2_31_9]